MSITKDNITKRIKYIRKSKRRSMHDCATILGLTRETYHSLEAGTTPLSLPELELLSIYLGVNPSDFLNDDQHHQPFSAYLNEDIRPRYLALREKMIRARIAIERENRSLTLEDVEKATHISTNVLRDYDQGDEPIPLQDLISISEYLEIPMNTLLEPLWETAAPADEQRGKAGWQPEFVGEEKQETTPAEDPYADLLEALKMLPKHDQAQVAKLLLEKLRSI